MVGSVTSVWLSARRVTNPPRLRGPRAGVAPAVRVSDEAQISESSALVVDWLPCVVPAVLPAEALPPRAAAFPPLPPVALPLCAVVLPPSELTFPLPTAMLLPSRIWVLPELASPPLPPVACPLPPW